MVCGMGLLQEMVSVGNGPNEIRGNSWPRNTAMGFSQAGPIGPTFETRLRRPLEAFQIGPMAGDVPGGFAGPILGPGNSMGKLDHKIKHGDFP